MHKAVFVLVLFFFFAIGYAIKIGKDCLCPLGCDCYSLATPCPDGKCIFCKSDYWGGDTCSNKCSEDCVKEYANNCNRDTGYCEACRSSNWGHFCEKKCSDGCYTEYSRNCDREIGFCVECKRTRWGNDFCQNTCPKNCGTEYQEICHRETGKCVYCRNGYVGPYCAKNSYYQKICTTPVEFLLKKVIGFGECMPMGGAVATECLSVAWEIPIVGEAFCVGIGAYVWRLCDKVGTEVIKGMIGDMLEKLCDPAWQYPDWHWFQSPAPNTAIAAPDVPHWPAMFTAEVTATFFDTTIIKSIITCDAQENIFAKNTTSEGLIISSTVMNCTSQYVYARNEKDCTYMTGTGCNVSHDYLQQWIRQQGFTSSVLSYVEQTICDDIQCNHWRISEQSEHAKISLSYFEDVVLKVPLHVDVSWGDKLIVQYKITSFKQKADLTMFEIPDTCKEAK